jgi:hypothetical protein
MDKRFLSDRKLETYADMAGMTVYRNSNNKIVSILYEDYSFGDPDEEWQKREELFPSDPDEERLPDKTHNRYFMFYHWTVGGEYKTQADIDLEIATKEKKARSKEGRAHLKAEEKAAEELKRRKELIARDKAKREAAEQRRLVKKANAWTKEKRAAHSKEYHRLRNLDEARRLASKAEEARQRVEAKEYLGTISRRARQKEAMDNGRQFSSPQDGLGAGIVTWSDPLITDVRLVRLVLASVKSYVYKRSMTPEEESDYWYWKARCN